MGMAVPPFRLAIKKSFVERARLTHDRAVRMLLVARLAWNSRVGAEDG